MRMINLTCPHCGAELTVDAERQQAFCQYCGTKLLIDDDRTININQRIIDEARLKEAEVRLKELEFAHERSVSYAKEKRSWRLLITLYIAALVISYLVSPRQGFGYVLVFGALAVIFLKPQERYARQANYYVSDKSRGLALVLCFLFGIFGAHYFYVGRTWMGIFYLLTFGFGGIGWLIDLFRIAFGFFRDSRGYPLK